MPQLAATVFYAEPPLSQGREICIAQHTTVDAIKRDLHKSFKDRLGATYAGSDIDLTNPILHSNPGSVIIVTGESLFQYFPP